MQKEYLEQRSYVQGEEKEKKRKLSRKGLIGVAAGAAALVVLACIAVLVFRVDDAEAREVALNRSGGGQIVSQEMERDGLLHEYKYTIQNGNTWYEIEIDGFGNVTEMESSMGGYR